MKLVSFLSVLPLLTSALAQAGGDTGGGNFVDNKLVESYMRDPADPKDGAPNFSEVDRYLHMFDEKIPNCGKELRAIAHPDSSAPNSVAWYILPEKIKTLPTSVTKLNFSTKQPVMQTDRQIFVSRPGVSHASKNEQGLTYLHEILMMNQDDKDGESVRRLMFFLKQQNYNPSDVALRDLMKELNFDCAGGLGDKYPTGSELKAEAALKAPAMALVKEEQKKTMGDFLVRAQALCQGGQDGSDWTRLTETFLNAKFNNYNLSDEDQAKLKLPETVAWSDLHNEVSDTIVDAKQASFDKLFTGSSHFTHLAATLFPCERYDANNQCSLDSLWAWLGGMDQSGSLLLKLNGVRAGQRGLTDVQRLKAACDDVAALRSASSADASGEASSEEQTGSGSASRAQ